MIFEDTEAFSTEDTEVARLSTTKDIVVLTQAREFNFKGELIKDRYYVMVQIAGKAEYFDTDTLEAGTDKFKQYAKEVIKNDVNLADLFS